MTFQIITDSTADLPVEYLKDNHLVELGMTVTVDGENYQTVGEGRLTADQLLEMLKTAKDNSTSAIPSGEFQEVFTKFAQEGKEVLYLAFSSGLSGTYQSAVIARDMVLEEYPDAKITIIDSLAAASGEGYLLEEVVRLQSEGKSVAEIVDILDEIVPRLKSWFMVDDLNFLARGGRISKTSALVGSMASIKPVLDVDPEGHLRPVSKARGSKKAINSLIDNTVADFDASYPKINIAYSGEATKSVAEGCKTSFLEKLGTDLNVAVRPLGPVISAHTGAGTIAIFSIGKTERK